MTSEINQKCDEIIQKVRNVYDYVRNISGDKIAVQEANELCVFMRNIETSVILLNDTAISSLEKTAEETRVACYIELCKFEK